jgi:hypothetical protein
MPVALRFSDRAGNPHLDRLNRALLGLATAWSIATIVAAFVVSARSF